MIKILRKIIIIVILVSFLILLTSCTGERELDTLGIVVSTGFDLEDGRIIITNEVINPTSKAGEGGIQTQEDMYYITGEGETIRDAISRTLLTFDRRLYYSHNRLVIFGEEFAKKGIGQYFDLLSRGFEQRENAFLLVAKGGSAYDIMGLNSGLANSAGRYLFDILKDELFNAQTRTLSISNFLKYYYRPKEGYIFGTVNVVQSPQINKSLPSDIMEILCTEGGAVFDQDKLVGYYSANEMVGFNYLVDELKSYDMVFETPKFVEDFKKQRSTKGKYTVIETFKSKTKLEVKLEEEELHLHINVRISGGLKESSQLLDLSDPGILEAVENACAKRQEEIIRTTLDKGQKEFGIDTFSIGRLVHRTYPKLWKDIQNHWEEVFSELNYTINVQVSITDTGLTNTPPNLRKDNKNE